MYRINWGRQKREAGIPALQWLQPFSHHAVSGSIGGMGQEERAYQRGEMRKDSGGQLPGDKDNKNRQETSKASFPRKMLTEQVCPYELRANLDLIFPPVEAEFGNCFWLCVCPENCQCGVLMAPPVILPPHLWGCKYHVIVILYAVFQHLERWPISLLFSEWAHDRE